MNNKKIFTVMLTIVFAISICGSAFAFDFASPGAPANDSKQGTPGQDTVWNSNDLATGVRVVIVNLSGGPVDVSVNCNYIGGQAKVDMDESTTVQSIGFPYLDNVKYLDFDNPDGYKGVSFHEGNGLTCHVSGPRGSGELIIETPPYFALDPEDLHITGGFDSGYHIMNWDNGFRSTAYDWAMHGCNGIRDQFAEFSVTQFKAGTQGGQWQHVPFLLIIGVDSAQPDPDSYYSDMMSGSADTWPDNWGRVRYAVSGPGTYVYPALMDGFCRGNSSVKKNGLFNNGQSNSGQSNLFH